MLEKKDLENIEFGYNEAISIIEGVNPLIQMQYSLYFNAVLKEKKGKLYYIKETPCKNGYDITEFPFKNISKELKELIEELQDTAIQNYMLNKGICVRDPLQNIISTNSDRYSVYMN